MTKVGRYVGICSPLERVHGDVWTCGYNITPTIHVTGYVEKGLTSSCENGMINPSIEAECPTIFHNLRQ